MTSPTLKQKAEALRERIIERLKDNPEALARYLTEEDLKGYQRATEWYLGKTEKYKNKVARIRKHLLR